MTATTRSLPTRRRARVSDSATASTTSTATSSIFAFDVFFFAGVFFVVVVVFFVAMPRSTAAVDNPHVSAGVQQRMQGDRAWTGRLFFGPDWLLYAGPVAPTTLHAHHALQIVVAVDDAVTMADASGRALACRTAIVPPRAAHAIAVGAMTTLVLHVPTDKPAGRRLCALPISAADVAAWQTAGAAVRSFDALPVTWDDAVVVVDRLLDDVGATSTGSPPARHPAVLQVLRMLPALLGDGDVSAAALAARCRLSVSRLSHLFNDEVGTPLRPFILWLRLQTAGRHISSGASLTQAAHAAGFHDSAHLSRVFKTTFGLSPSTLLGNIHWVLPPVTP